MVRHAPIWIEAACAIALVIITGTYTHYAANQRDAMLKSNEINREALESVQRAFISFPGVQSEAVYAIDKNTPAKLSEFRFHAQIQNNGNTPASEAVGMFFGDSTLSTEPDEKQFLNRIVAPWHGMVGAKEAKIFGDHRIPYSYFLGEGGKRPTGDGKLLFFWGFVIYHDILPKTKTHVTEFCQLVDEILVNADRPQTLSGQYKFTFRDCNQHNCADEQCKDYKEITRKDGS